MPRQENPRSKRQAISTINWRSKTLSKTHRSHTRPTTSSIRRPSLNFNPKISSSPKRNSRRDQTTESPRSLTQSTESPRQLTQSTIRSIQPFKRNSYRTLSSRRLPRVRFMILGTIKSRRIRIRILGPRTACSLRRIPRFSKCINISMGTHQCTTMG